MLYKKIILLETKNEINYEINGIFWKIK